MLITIIYRKNILQALKDAGYNTNRLRQEKIFGESFIQQFRRGEIVSIPKLNKLCGLLQCQPGDLLEYIPDDSGTGGVSYSGSEDQKNLQPAAAGVAIISEDQGTAQKSPPGVLAPLSPEAGTTS